MNIYVHALVEVFCFLLFLGGEGKVVRGKGGRLCRVNTGLYSTSTC